VIDYVLRRAPAAEQSVLDVAIAAGIEALPHLLTEGADRVMNTLHRHEPAPLEN